MSPLKIYKASAGSGKTFALTLEYLKLLFLIPGVHRHILAVTFTNKAAGEMKHRILNCLHDLSRKEGKNRLEEMEQLKESTGMDEASIRLKAGALLNTILNDYSGFSVGTIDKFFQSVIRAFTREIGIQPGYNLELDHHRVLSMAVDRLFQDLSENEKLQRWLIRFAEERMEEARSWNFRQEIIQLGMQLFRESFQGLFLEQDLGVLEKENMDLYLKEINQLEKQVRKEMVSMGKSALEQMDRAGLQVEDFRLKGKSPPSLFLAAVAGEELNFTQAKLDALDESAKWLNKNAPESMSALTVEELMPMLNLLYQKQKVLNTLTAIRQNYYTLGILGDIWEHVREYTRERNLFLIADSSRFLRRIIGGNQVPFIYERTGSRYRHIMLDEFQDTSVFQYDNFKPLLDNALAGGNENLVVGDVKQSIYRWRNSDWKILASDLQQDFSHQHSHVFTLGMNYRSREELIRFNNTVFQLAPEVLAQTIEEELYSSSVHRSEAQMEVGRFRNAYADAVQQIPSHRKDTGGMVKIEFFEEDDRQEFREQALSRIPEWIEEIRRSGVEPGETAILVRSRKEGIAVANTLLEHAKSTGEHQGFRLISNESLLLIHNSSIALLLSALKYLVYPGDALNNALLKYKCFLSDKTRNRDSSQIFDTSLPMDMFLPAEVQNRVHLLRQLPLYELTESLIKAFGLDQNTRDLPYLQAFQDLIIDLQRKEALGIQDFLQYWEQHGSQKGLSVSEESNAIRILTIHKAKGLEFKAVIIPFCNWEITTDQRKSTILWCETGDTPLSRIPVVPVRYSSRMQHTLFSPAYYRERMKGYMDSLNLMYVAFTRARDLLFIGAPFREENTMDHTGDLLQSIVERTAEKNPALNSLKNYRSGNLIQIGALPGYIEKPMEKDPWLFTSYPVNEGKRSLRVRLRSDEYFVDEEGTFRTEQMYGNMMHMVFSRISGVKDVDSILQTMQRDGLLTENQRFPLEEKIREMISRPGIESWFSEEEGRSIYNERNILGGEGILFRPDRVIVEAGRVIVVDFKFGRLEKKSYRVQVRNYMQQLMQMGYKNVEGYIWYVILDKTVKIDME
ncbi:MAG: UvrD-helicase domain-containing protein [Bacteroidota bacterium]